MPELRVLLVDDEAPARARLRRMLQAESGVTVAGEAEDGARAIESIRALDPDLVLLDIQMPNGTGFDVIDAVGPDAMPPVIFVTAYDEHALRAFEVRALDYLLKPVAADRLAQALARARDDTMDRATRAVTMHDMLESVAPRQHLSRILVHLDDRAVLVAVDRIDWIEADRNYVWLHSAGKSVLHRQSISAIEARLDPQRFLRVSRSVIVRLDAVREFHPWSHGDYRVVLHDGTTTMWSRRYRARSGALFG